MAIKWPSDVGETKPDLSKWFPNGIPTYSGPRDFGDLTGKFDPVRDVADYRKYLQSLGMTDYFGAGTIPEGALSYPNWQALMNSFPKPTTAPGGGGGTTPPPNGGGGNTTPLPDTCVNGICPMPGLPTAYQKPQTIPAWANWANQLPGAVGAVQNPLFQYQSLGMSPSNMSGITGLLGQLFKQ